MTCPCEECNTKRDTRADRRCLVLILLVIVAAEIAGIAAWWLV